MKLPEWISEAKPGTLGEIVKEYAQGKTKKAKRLEKKFLFEFLRRKGLK